MLTSFPHKTSAGFLTTYFVTISKWYVDSVPEKTERFATVFGGSIEHLPKGYTRANCLEKLPCPSCRYSQMHNLFIIHVRKRQDLLRKYWTTLNVYYHPPPPVATGHLVLPVVVWGKYRNEPPCVKEIPQKKRTQCQERPVVCGVDDIYWWWMNMAGEVAWTEQGGLAAQGVNQS